MTLVGESRGARRVEVALQAQVKGPLGGCCAAQVTNLSASGMRLEGGRQLVDTLLPNRGGGEAERRQANIKVSFFLDAAHSDGVEVTCQSVYVRRLQRDWFQIGLHYTEIGADAEWRLATFIRSV